MQIFQRRGCGRALGFAVLLLAAAGCHRAGGAESPLECTREDPSVDSEALLSELDLLAHHGPIIPTERQLDGLERFVNGRQHRGWCHDRFRNDDIRRTGPLVPLQSRTTGEVQHTALGTHARVRVYYSDDVVTWLEGGRQGAIPDGAMIVKEMYPGLPGPKDHVVDGWAVMVRDSQASYDGWLWYLYYKPGNAPYTLPFESGQYGMSFCVSCHASAERQGTFAFLGNLIDTDVATFVELPAADLPGAQAAASGAPPDGAHGRLAGALSRADGLRDELTGNAPNSQEKALFRALLYLPLHVPRQRLNEFPTLFDIPGIEEIARREPRILPMDAAYDHVPPAGTDDPARLFVTASVCSGCHEAADLVNGTNPEMTVPVGAHRFDKLQFPLMPDPELAALTPYGEWSASLMSLSARDPVFRAQLEWETARYPERAEDTRTFCFGCHAPMGQRAFPALRDKLANTYQIPDEVDPARNAEAARFAALARDGVSCAVCHHITDENLGKPESFNGRFVTGAPQELYGPYQSVKTAPMKAGLGIEPVHGAHLADSGLCGTCHMVETPVADSDTIDSAHEQTTYLEWRNSDYGRAGHPRARTCQGCHMPDTNPLSPTAGEPTRGQIANIEDSTFPYTANRRRSGELDTEVRTGYRRHTLAGINLFTMSFFQQFPWLLGSNTFYPVRAFSKVVSPKALAMDEMTRLAQHQTASLEIAGRTADDEALRVDVRITNLAGHKFPSGVGFRRAFVTAELTDEAGKRVWCSGCSDPRGVIVDGQGAPLASEFPGRSDTFEPYYPVISRQDQVQIFESRHVNAAGRLTTSFLELDREVKDTRLLPAGWDPDAFPEYGMNPVGRPVSDPSHVEAFSYRIPLADARRAARVTVSINYQALPPYYLIDRMALLNGDAPSEAYPETQRLLHLLSHLDLERDSAARAIRGWKLEIDRAEHTLDW